MVSEVMFKCPGILKLDDWLQQYFLKLYFNKTRHIVQVLRKEYYI